MSQAFFKIGSLAAIGAASTVNIIAQVTLAPRISPLAIVASITAYVIVGAAIYVPLERKLTRSQHETQLPPIRQWIVDPSAPGGLREASTHTAGVLQEHADEIEGRQ